MTDILINAHTRNNWQRAGTTATLRIWFSGEFRDSNGVMVTPGNGSSSFYKIVPCTVNPSAHTISIPQFTLPSTLDGTPADIQCHGRLYDASNAQREFLWQNWSLSNTPTTLNYNSWFIFNQGNSLSDPPDFYLNRQEVLALIESMLGLAGQGVVPEIPAGVINGVNGTFTLSQVPVTGSVELYLNGVLQQEGSLGAGTNSYTISGTTITHNGPPLPGDWLFATYRTTSVLLAAPSLASLTNIGVTSLSSAPANPLLPIAVGDTDVRANMYINVKSPAYGAVGDGVTNDAAAIQLAINAAVTLSLPLYMPPGTYFTGSTVIVTPTTANGKLTILGAGKGITRITRTAGIATSCFDFKFTGASALIKVTDFTIVGPPDLLDSNAAVGINWITATIGHRFRMERVEITGTYDAAVQHSGGGTVEVIDCDLNAMDVCFGMFESTAAANSAFIHVSGGIWSTTGHLANSSVGLYVHPHIAYLVEGVVFKDLARYGIYQNGSPGTARKAGICVGCQFIDAEMAQTRTAGLSVFSGCSVEGFGSAGIGSSLAGEVLITGSIFKDTLLSTGPVSMGDVTLTGCTFIDAGFIVSTSGATHHVQVRASTFIVTDAGSGLNLFKAGFGFVDLDNLVFWDQTVSLVYQSCVTIEGSAIARISNLRTSGTMRGTLGVIYGNGGSVTLDNCDVDGNVNWASGGPAVDSWSGSNNLFRGTGRFSGASVLQQRIIRRAGVNPSTVASAVNLDTSTTVWLSYDTQIITGSAAIANLTNPYPCVGVIRLVVAAGGTWSTANSGNILPLTTAARAAGAVVNLLWEPLAAKWIEF